MAWPAPEQSVAINTVRHTLIQRRRSDLDEYDHLFSPCRVKLRPSACADKNRIFYAIESVSIKFRIQYLLILLRRLSIDA